MPDFPSLPQIHIANPCHEDWEQMQGDSASRFCAHCSRSVQNLSEMTAAEVRDIVESGESVCVRMRRRADGTIVTRRGGLGRRLMAATASLLASLTIAGCSRETGDVGAIPSDPLPPEDHGELLMGDICVVEPVKQEPQESEPVVLMGRVQQPLTPDGAEHTSEP